MKIDDGPNVLLVALEKMEERTHIFYLIPYMFASKYIY